MMKKCAGKRSQDRWQSFSRFVGGNKQTKKKKKPDRMKQKEQVSTTAADFSVIGQPGRTEGKTNKTFSIIPTVLAWKQEEINSFISLVFYFI
jgi:hypothetical protein